VSFRPCVLIPVYDNPNTIRAVVEAVREKLPSVLVVDDGSARDCRERVEELGREELAEVVRRPVNGGKGAAVKTGFQAALDLGYTHALQVDADGQHDLGDLDRFLAAARDNPTALVLGYPVFDETVPRGRLLGRQLTIFWTRLETFGRSITDPMCGYRVYPLAAALKACRGTGDHMEFDIEIAVRMLWNGAKIVNLPTGVRYFRKDQGGVSHFHMWKDNCRITWCHTRLVTLAILRALYRPFRKLMRR